MVLEPNKSFTRGKPIGYIILSLSDSRNDEAPAKKYVSRLTSINEIRNSDQIKNQSAKINEPR